MGYLVWRIVVEEEAWSRGGGGCRTDLAATHHVEEVQHVQEGDEPVLVRVHDPGHTLGEEALQNSTVATVATVATIATFASIATVATVSTVANIATFDTFASIPTIATVVTIATRASTASLATIATVRGSSKAILTMSKYEQICIPDTFP